MKYFIYTCLFMAVLNLNAQQTDKDRENKWLGNRPDGHAPISVMADHTHGKGEFMLSYRFMAMNMETLQFGSRSIANVEVLRPKGNYKVVPTQMPMDMHMLGLMYAPSDKVTLYAMGSIMSMAMDHITAMGGRFTTEVSGISDTKVGLLYKFFNKNRTQLHGQLGLVLPTGSINEKDVTPASNGQDVILPYPMQLGSGTVGSVLGLTYLLQYDALSFGSQLQGVLNFGKNKNDYRLGNAYVLNSWMAYKLNTWFSVSARLQGQVVSKLSGANPNLNPQLVTTANTNNSGATYLNSGLGFNFYVFKGDLKNLRFGFEISRPLVQNVNGVQLKKKENLVFGLQYAL